MIAFVVGGVHSFLGHCLKNVKMLTTSLGVEVCSDIAHLLCAGQSVRMCHGGEAGVLGEPSAVGTRYQRGWGPREEKRRLNEAKTWEVSKICPENIGVSMVGMGIQHGEYIPDKDSSGFKYVC